MGDWGFEWDASANTFGDTSSATNAGTGGSSLNSDAVDSLVKGFMNMIGMRKQNELNRSNMEWSFQRSLDARRTAVQDRVADLAAAGLNPMLAIRGEGAASSPEAPVGAPMGSPVSAGISTAMAARLQNAEIRKMEADADRAGAEARVAEVMVPKVVGDTLGAGQSAAKVSAEISRIGEEVRMLSAKREQLLQAATTARAQGGKFDAERELAEVDAKLRRLESIHEGLRIAVTLPHAEKAGTFFGKYISPYLSDIGAISSAAASGRFTMKGVGR